MPPSRKAGELIAKAKRPIAVLGSSAMRMAKPDLLRQVIERHNLPFATTTMAKGMIDEDHPLSIGVIERSCRQIQRKLLRSADLIVGLGYDTVEVEYEAWIGDVPLLQIDIEKVDVAPSVKVAHEVTGDLDAFAGEARRPARQQQLLDARCAGRAPQGFPRGAAARHQHLHRPCRDRRGAPRAAARGPARRSTSARTPTRSPASGPRTRRRRFHITNGWSSMGFGLPGAIAAKLARPDLPVVCMLGDGCFQMTCGEVAVAKRMGIALPVVVLDDKWLALIKVKQIRRQFPLYGTELQAEDYTEPPQHYFGVPAVGVRSAAALESAVTKALSAKGPTVIEAVVDSDHYVDTVYD